MVARSVRLPEELIERAQEAAKAQDRTFGWVVRTALESWLNMRQHGGGPPVMAAEVAPTGPGGKSTLWGAEAIKYEAQDKAPESFKADFTKLYTCPEPRCVQTSPKPGTCPIHRTKRLVKA